MIKHDCAFMHAIELLKISFYSERCIVKISCLKQNCRCFCRLWLDIWSSGRFFVSNLSKPEEQRY
uniref:Uncharacterized protein n=1 Tax=Oryza punctata TaxID=4537 RepID=A0A0E0M3E6_ORYPU